VSTGDKRTSLLKTADESFRAMAKSNGVVVMIIRAVKTVTCRNKELETFFGEKDIFEWDLGKMYMANAEQCHAML